MQASLPENKDQNTDYYFGSCTNKTVHQEHDFQKLTDYKSR